MDGAGPMGQSASVSRFELLRNAAPEPLARSVSPPWPGLTGRWLYTCALELQVRGAYDHADFQVELTGPGLPWEGWSLQPDAHGRLTVPELAIGSYYSFTIPPGYWVLPALGVDLLQPDRFAVEPYSALGADGTRPTMVEEVWIARAGTRVRLVDEQGGELWGAEIEVVNEENSAAQLACGESHWLVADGTIPLPVPTSSATGDPLLRVRSPADVWMDLPLSPWVLIEALEQGKLVVERLPSPLRIRFEVLTSEGRPSVKSRVVEEKRKTIATADESGRFDFLSSSNALVLMTPGYPDKGLVLEDYADEAPGLAEWPRIQLVHPGTVLVSVEDWPRETLASVSLSFKVTGDEWIHIRSPRSFYTTRDSGESLGRCAFNTLGTVEFSSMEACTLVLTVEWWHTPIQTRVIALVPESQQVVAWEAPPAGGGPARILILGADGAPCGRTEVFGAPSADWQEPAHEPKIALGRTDAAGWLNVPAWPTTTSPHLRLTPPGFSAPLQFSVLAALAEGGKIILPPVPQDS